MSNWNKISLYKFQQIDAINSRADLEELDKGLFSTCVVFDMTEYQLDNAEPKKAGRLLTKAGKIFRTPFTPKPYKRIGKYFLNYDPSLMSFGQYVELSFFLQAPIKNAHYVMASISNTAFRKNDSKDHRKKAAYFLTQPVIKITGSLAHFSDNFKEFNNEYSKLFGLNPEVHGDVAKVDPFNKRYGWVYSAETVAAHERITLDEAYRLPVRQALNDLIYLKAKEGYEKELLKTRRF